MWIERRFGVRGRVSDGEGGRVRRSASTVRDTGAKVECRAYDAVPPMRCRG
jgi:hypothetical protein